MVPKRDTRQQILTEAFLLYDDLRNAKFSLSELAAKVGISKTAIFRHFKNKDALVLAMEETLYKTFADFINPKNYFFARDDAEYFTFEEFSDFIDTVITMFLHNPGYLGFAINSGIWTKNTEVPIFQILNEHGIYFSDSYIQKKSINRFFRVYFCVESLIYFFARRACVERTEPENLVTENDFKRVVIDILWNGIAFENYTLSKEREKFLDKICECRIDENSEDTRFFMAFTEVFNEYGIEGIRVERISEKLNLAKSSLYSYFNNKDEYITKMLSSEVQLIMNLLTDKLKQVQSVEEIAYVLLRSETNYLEKRPYVLMIHSWASQQGFGYDRVTQDEKRETDEKLMLLEEKGYKIKNNLGLKTFLGWGSSVIGALKIYFKIPGGQIDHVKILFDLMCHGMSNNSGDINV